MKQLSILFFSCAFLASCTGMNKSECMNANWEIIGLEDGSYGRDLSYANRHQSDCSKYDSQVDMASYRVGHAEGVRTFCRAENGFRVGRSGRSYSGICPPDLEDAFLSEYETGIVFHALDEEISQTQSSITRLLMEIDDLNEEIDRKAERAVQLDITKEQRDRIQDDMRVLQFEILDLERLVGELQLHLEDQQIELDNLSNYYGR